MKSYSEHRKERLSDAIFEYLSDENTTAEELISDFYAEVKSSFDYFDKYAKKCEKVMNKLPKKVALADDCAKKYEKVLKTLDAKEIYEKDPDTKYSKHYYDIDRNGKSSFNETKNPKDWEDFWSSLTEVDTINTTNTKKWR